MYHAPELPGINHGRVLEPEVMDDDQEVLAYKSGVQTDHLDSLDDTFVAAALSKLRKNTSPRSTPCVLDVGCGSGAIAVKMVAAMAGFRMVGVDRSASMLLQARALVRDADLSNRLEFRRADGRRLPFPDRSQDLVVSNSLMHHLPDPTPVLDEIARVLKPSGALFIRDLRRPSPLRIAAHIKIHGRFYRGTMYQLFAASVRAAFTLAEIREIVNRSRLGRRRRRPPRVHRHLTTYLVVNIP